MAVRRVQRVVSLRLYGLGRQYLCVYEANVLKQTLQLLHSLNLRDMRNVSGARKMPRSIAGRRGSTRVDEGYPYLRPMPLACVAQELTTFCSPTYM